MPRQRVWIAIAILTAASLGASLAFIQRHLAYRKQVTNATKSNLTSLTNGAARSIDQIVVETANQVDEVAKNISNGQLTDEAALKEIHKLLEPQPYWVAAVLAYKPLNGKKTGLFAPGYLKKHGIISYVRLEKVYDYTSPKWKWFKPATTGKPFWSQPFFGEASDKLLVSYSAPFFKIDAGTRARIVAGVVVVCLSADEIGRIVESLDTGSTGFGALVAQNGTYLYHPDQKLVLSQKTLRDIAQQENDSDRTILAIEVEKRGSGMLEHRSRTTGQDAWLVFAPIPTTGWSLQNTFFKDHRQWDIKSIRHQLIKIVISLVLFLSFAAALLLMVLRRSKPWTISAIITVLLSIGIGMVWKISLEYDSINETNTQPLSDRASLQQAMNAYRRRSLDQHTEPPEYVPTGIYVESASFNSSSELSVSGYLWQKYQLGAQDLIPRGFTINGASQQKIEEKLRLQENGFEIVRWYFQCTVAQAINHSKYPLEQARLSLEIQHKDLNHNVLLVPDLVSYNLTNPVALPGLRKGLVLAGWNISRSQFELRNVNRQVNFGLERSLNKEAFPAFCFCIEIKRIFMDAFISNLTSLILVAILLFTMLLLPSGDSRVLNICASMFFVVAFSHIDMRRKISAEGVVFLEYFYFLAYFAILAISTDSVANVLGRSSASGRGSRNLDLKTLFWPTLLGMLFAISVYKFY